MMSRIQEAINLMEDVREIEKLMYKDLKRYQKLYPSALEQISTLNNKLEEIREEHKDEMFKRTALLKKALTMIGPSDNSFVFIRRVNQLIEKDE